MTFRLLSVLGSVSALALLSSAALASPVEETSSRVRPAQSFGELLDPVPDAVNVLKADDALGAMKPVQLAQYDEDNGYGYRRHHHHHHHHHGYYHHHHHHFRGYPGFGFFPRHHHHHHFYHHHHHHHHHFYNGD